MKIHSPKHQTAVVDTSYEPLASLLQYVDGSSWEVEYYSQVLGADSEPGPLQLNRSPTDQQYVKISNMELRVISPLAPVQESPGRSMEVRGNALVYPHITPNVGDMFVADIGDGRAGVFAITRADRKTHLRESHVEVEYQLVDYGDKSAPHRLNLELKTVKRTVFHREFMHWGQNPQILEGEYGDLVELKHLYRDLTNFYVKDFYSTQFRTLLIPNQDQVAYDPFLTDAVLDWLSVDDVPMLRRVRRLTVSANRNAESYTLWSALSRLNDSYLHTAVHHVRLLNTRAFQGLPEISSIYYTGVCLVACPMDPRTDVDAPYDEQAGCFSDGNLLSQTGLRWKDLTRYVPSSNLKGFFKDPSTSPELPDIVPVTVDEYYVLSERFYRPTEGVPMASKLEVLTKQALRQEPIDRVTLLNVAKHAMKWPNLERFYYMPILFALMKVALRTN